jgi:hypothetical protein
LSFQLEQKQCNKVENSAIKCYFIAPFLAKNGAVIRIGKRSVLYHPLVKISVQVSSRKTRENEKTLQNRQKITHFWAKKKLNQL